jgi:copper chaperone CopZ
MSTDVSRDQLVLIRIEGMHCHKCEQSISRAVNKLPGVYEVEVDFNAGLASVLFDRDRIAVSELMAAVGDAGYDAVGFNQREAV